MEDKREKVENNMQPLELQHTPRKPSW